MICSAEWLLVWVELARANADAYAGLIAQIRICLTLVTPVG